MIKVNLRLNGEILKTFESDIIPREGEIIHINNSEFGYTVICVSYSFEVGVFRECNISLG